jgi:predicted  nucleic acid-binding Zn-ribbon protein
MIDIRLPNITGSTEREQLLQMKSYLHQLAEQLQWALQNVDTNNNTSVVMPTARSLAPIALGSVGQSDPQATFASIKSLIIKSAEIVDAYYDEINARLEGLYVAQSDFGTYVEETNALIEANSKGITQTYTNVQTLQSTVGDIDTTVQTLGGTVQTIDSTVQTIGGTVETLGGTVQTLDSTIQTVDGKVDTVAEEASTNLYDVKTGLQENLNALSGAVSDQETALQDVKDGAEKSIADVQNSVDGLSGDIDDVKDDVDKKTKALDEAIKATNVVVATVTGTIKTGELYKDEMGLPVFGLEIGQRNTIDGVETFNKYARFVSNRLSFYDSGGYEVAYVSDSKLYITHAEITSSFKLGGFVDTVMADGRVVTKWVGGN